MASDEKKIQDRIRTFVEKSKVHLGMYMPVCYQLLEEAADKIDELEERVAIMSEDQYKSSEIRFP